MSKRKIFAGAAVAIAAGLAGALLMIGTSAGAATTVTERYAPFGGIAVGPSGPASSRVAASPYCCPSDALELTTGQVVTENDSQWMQLALPWDNPTITSVRVCYQVFTSTPGSTYISQTRLTSMTMPNSATVVLDEPTDRTSTAPACYSVKTALTPTGALTLNLKVVFGHPGDRITIGMVSLTGKTA